MSETPRVEPLAGSPGFFVLHLRSPDIIVDMLLSDAQLAALSTAIVQAKAADAARRHQFFDD